MKKENDAYAYISIVAIVAIVAVFVMFSGNTKETPQINLDGDDLVGDARRIDSRDLILESSFGQEQSCFFSQLPEKCIDYQEYTYIEHETPGQGGIWAENGCNELAPDYCYEEFQEGHVNTIHCSNNENYCNQLNTNQCNENLYCSTEQNLSIWKSCGLGLGIIIPKLDPNICWQRTSYQGTEGRWYEGVGYCDLLTEISAGGLEWEVPSVEDWQKFINYFCEDFNINCNHENVDLSSVINSYHGNFHNRFQGYDDIYWTKNQVYSRYNTARVVSLNDLSFSSQYFSNTFPTICVSRVYEYDK